MMPIYIIFIKLIRDPQLSDKGSARGEGGRQNMVPIITVKM